MIYGVSHVTIGVSNICESQRFYRDVLEFKEIVLDHSGMIPRVGPLASRDESVRARVVMLRSENVTPVGQGMVQLVQMLAPGVPRRQGVDHEWGNIGIAEICVHVKNIEETSKVLSNRGAKMVVPCNYSIADGQEHKYCYFRDPDGILIELIEWHMYKEFGGIPMLSGVNHVAVGVSDMEKSLGFYKDAFGFKEVIFDFSSSLDTMAPLLPSPRPRMRLALVTSAYRGAWLEPYQRLPPFVPGRTYTKWGDVGLLEFSIGVSNIEKEYSRLQKKGIQFLSSPQTLELSSSEDWKYAYFREPDDLCVSIVEY